MQANGRQVTKLNNGFVRQMEARRRYRIKVHVRRAKIIYGVILAILLIFGGQLLQSHQQLTRVNHQIAQQRAVLRDKRATGRRLSRQVTLLHDPDYLQQLIRSKYNYAKKGETIYNFAD